MWPEQRCQVLMRETLLDHTTGVSTCMAGLALRLLQLLPTAGVEGAVPEMEEVVASEVAEAEAEAAVLDLQVAEAEAAAVEAEAAVEEAETAAMVAAEQAEEAEGEGEAVVEEVEAAEEEAAAAVEVAAAAAMAVEAAVEAVTIARLGRLSASQVARLDVALYTLSSSQGPVHLGLPSLEQLVERGLAVPGADGGLRIPIRLGPRVSTQPGTMGINNEPQRRASVLDDAASQRLQLPTTQALSPLARAFNMCPERLAARR